MELRDYLAIIWRRKLVVALAVVGTTLTVGVIAELMPSVYTASTTLRITTVASQSPETVSYDSIMYSGRLLNTYSRIALSDVAQWELADRLGVKPPPRVKVEVPPNSELLQITVEGPTPTFVVTAANMMAEILISRVRVMAMEAGRSDEIALMAQLEQVSAELEETRAEILGVAPENRDALAAATRSLNIAEERYARVLDQYRRVSAANASRANAISVIEPAIEPTSPASPQKRLMLTMGALFGLLAGISLGFMFDRMDKRLRTPDGIAGAADLPVIAEIPASSLPPKGAHNSLFDSSTPAREAFRRLGANLVASAPRSPITLAITSAEPGEGKSTVVANLGAALAQAGRRVVIVDADLRAPTQHRLLGVPNQSGLSLLLSGEGSWDEVTRQTIFPGLAVITSGPVPPDALELLAPRRIDGLLSELGRWFDFVLVDTPSILAVADATTLAPAVDHVILVAACGRVRSETARAAREELFRAGAESVAMIVNRVEPARSFPYYQSAKAA